MVNPVLTILFDLVLIGSALGSLLWMAWEQLDSRHSPRVPAMPSSPSGEGQATPWPGQPVQRPAA